MGEQFRKRLLLLDKSGVGRVSIEDFHQGMICDEHLGRCLAQVGARITEETESHPLVQKLTFEPFKIESPPFEKKQSIMRLCENCFRCIVDAAFFNKAC